MNMTNLTREEKLTANKMRAALLTECDRLSSEDTETVQTPAAYSLRATIAELGDASLLRLAKLLRSI
jgi:hypothetical protein